MACEVGLEVAASAPCSRSYQNSRASEVPLRTLVVAKCWFVVCAVVLEMAGGAV